VSAHVHQLSVSNGGVPKLPVPEAEVTPGGIVGDRQRNRLFHGGPKRAVCLFPLEEIERLRAEGHPISPGTTGENVTVAGLPWDRVRPGARLALGAEVVLTGFGRARRMTETLLAGIVERRVKLAIIDITGVRAVNTEAVHGIVQAVHAVRLIGAEVVLTGLRADVARTIIDLDVDLSGIVTFSALQRGILYAMDRVKGSRHGRALPRAENGR